MKCEDCAYNWADWDEDGNTISRPYCHYIGPAFWAPCEQEEDREDEEDEE